MPLIEQILATSNVRVALEKVITNNGASGIDGMKVGELRDYMKANWTSLKEFPDLLDFLAKSRAVCSEKWAE